MIENCPHCSTEVFVEATGEIEHHDNWGHGGAYAVRCPASNRNVDELRAANESAEHARVAWVAAGRPDAYEVPTISAKES